MSIVNARSTKDELIVEVDSLGGLPPGLVVPESQRGAALVRVPKVAVVPHQRLVVAARGATLFHTVLAGPMSIAPFDSPDDLMDHVPDFLKESHRMFLQLAAPTPDLRKLDNDGVIGIYSPRLGRIRALTFQVTSQGEVTIDELSKDGGIDVHLTPWFDELEQVEADALSTRGSIAAAPAEQLRLVHKHHPDLMTGGEIVSVRLTRHGISTRVLPEPNWRPQPWSLPQGLQS
ncbi:hypothetical protein [Roseateles sp. LKC17W]|uniref:Uncharacterized protein n=1 Tax=Pelomonas margarita TaxID=3299031 RepID=A0ABW7FMQ2_9BURK